MRSILNPKSNTSWESPFDRSATLAERANCDIPNELRSITLGQLHVDDEAPSIALHARDEKNRQGFMLPLCRDLASELREWIERTKSLTERHVLKTSKSCDLCHCQSGYRRPLQRKCSRWGHFEKSPWRDPRQMQLGKESWNSSRLSTIMFNRIVNRFEPDAIQPNGASKRIVG